MAAPVSMFLVDRSVLRPPPKKKIDPLCCGFVSSRVSRLAGSSAQPRLLLETPKAWAKCSSQICKLEDSHKHSSSKLYCDVRRLMPQPTLRGFAAVTVQAEHESINLVLNAVSASRFEAGITAEGLQLPRLGLSVWARLSIRGHATFEPFCRIPLQLPFSVRFTDSCLKRVSPNLGQGLDMGLPFGMAGRPVPSDAGQAVPLVCPKDNRCRL